MRRVMVLAVLSMAASACASSGSSDPAPASTSASTTVVDLGSSISSSTDGPFELVLSLPGASFSTEQAITGQASLSVTDGKAEKIAGSGAGPLAFSFTEVGGSRRMGPGYRADCRMFTIEPDTPIASILTKSGGWSADDPNAPFYQSFFADPEIHLPAGTWDIGAQAWFSDNDCGGPSHDMTATLRVVVTP